MILVVYFLGSTPLVDLAAVEQIEEHLGSVNPVQLVAKAISEGRDA